MRALLLRAEQLARVEQQRLLARIAAQFGERLFGAEIGVGPDSVDVRGRGLRRRWLTDPSLRFLSAGER